MESFDPFMVSGEEREKGRGSLLVGSMTPWILRDRVSREKGPECGLSRVKSAEPWMVELEKSRYRLRDTCVVRGCDASANE